MGSLRVGHDWVTSLSLFLSCIGEGNGNPLQCSCLENPRDGGAWWAAVYGVAKSRTWLKWLSSSSSSSRVLRGRTHESSHNALLQILLILFFYFLTSPSSLLKKSSFIFLNWILTLGHKTIFWFLDLSVFSVSWLYCLSFSIVTLECSIRITVAYQSPPHIHGQAWI